MPKKLGLALGGGGAWSIAGLGVIKTLQEQGIKIDYFAGCSMGSLIAAAYSSNFAGEDTLEKLEHIVSNMKLRHGIHFDPNKSYGLFSSEKIGKGFEKEIGKLNFEDLLIPLSVVATDFKTGEEVIFDKGPLTPAVTASSSFAFIFSPFEYQGRLLTDGGLSNPTPVDIVRKMGADIVIGVDVTSKRHLKRLDPKPAKWPGNIIKAIPPLHYITNRKLGGTFGQILDLLFSNLNRAKIETNPPDFLLVPEVTHMDQFSFHLAQDFIKEGARVTKEILPKLQKSLE